MEMDRPPACYFTWVEDGKQEIYLEWPNTHLWGVLSMAEIIIFFII